MRLNTEQLIETFHSYVTPRHEWLVGGEFERAVVRPDGSFFRLLWLLNKARIR